MTSAGSRAFSCRTPPRAQYYPSVTTTAAVMTPSPTHYYSTIYYPPATVVMFPPQYGTLRSPSKQCDQCSRYYDDDSSQVLLPDLTTLTPPNSSSIQVSVTVTRVVPASLLVCLILVNVCMHVSI